MRKNRINKFIVALFCLFLIVRIYFEYKYKNSSFSAIDFGILFLVLIYAIQGKGAK